MPVLGSSVAGAVTAQPRPKTAADNPALNALLTAYGSLASSGVDGQVLAVDSTSPLGLGWTQPAAPSTTVVYTSTFPQSLPTTWDSGDAGSYQAAPGGGVQLTAAGAADSIEHWVWQNQFFVSWDGLIVDATVVVDRGQFAFMFGYDTSNLLYPYINYAFGTGPNCNFFGRRDAVSATLVSNWGTDFPAVGTVRYWRIALTGGKMLGAIFAQDPTQNIIQDPVQFFVRDLTGSPTERRFFMQNIRVGFMVQNSQGLIVRRFQVSKQ